MSYSLTWLPVILESAGLKIALTKDWESRGRGDVGNILGVICHHTAGGRSGNMPSLNTLIKGRPDLSGPLAQLGLGRDGTYYIIAAGKCNHAGVGMCNGIRDGNTHFIGIEAENTGLSDDPWPAVQMDAYTRGVAAILKYLRLDASACCGHYEYALPPGRKTDPSFRMPEFREDVARLLGNNVPPAILIPRSEVGANGRPTLRRGARGKLVERVQQAVGVAVDGNFGSNTEAAVRKFQHQHDLVPDGIVGPKTWAVFDVVAIAA